MMENMKTQRRVFIQIRATRVRLPSIRPGYARLWSWFVLLLLLSVSCSLYARGSGETSGDEKGIYWSTSNESGDFSDWWIDQDGEAVFNNDGPGNEVSVTAEAARSGTYSIKMEVWDIDRYERACRIFRWSEHLTEGYFSSWLMFPVIPEVTGWNNIFQVKKKDYENNIIDPTFIHQLSYDEILKGGVLTLDHWNEEININPVGDLPVIKAREWFHIEWYYKDGVIDGALKVWVNDTLTWDLEGINTRGVDPDIQWGLALYGDGVNPGHHVMYADDHVIADHRVGSLFFGEAVPKLPFTDPDPYESKLDGLTVAAVPASALSKDRYVEKPVEEIRAESSIEGYTPEALIDGDPDTRWEGRTERQRLTYEFPGLTSLSGVGIAWAFIDEQVTSFSVELSEDGEHWTTAIDYAESIPDQKGIQFFEFSGMKEAGFLRIVGHHNDSGEWAQWISINEVEIRDKNGNAVNPVNVEASASQYPNVAAKTLDGNTADASRWSAETNWSEIILKLEKESEVNAFGLAFPFGDQGQTQFDVHVSSDSIIWDKVIADRLSPEGKKELLVFGSEVGTRKGRYVKITPKFTTRHDDDGLVAISEIRIYGPREE